jgi:hypothetical protein
MGASTFRIELLKPCQRLLHAEWNFFRTVIKPHRAARL